MSLLARRAARRAADDAFDAVESIADRKFDEALTLIAAASRRLEDARRYLVEFDGEDEPAGDAPERVVEYGVKVTRQGQDPLVYRWRSLAEAHAEQQRLAALSEPDRSYTVVSRTTTVTDWTPVDPIEVTR